LNSAYGSEVSVLTGDYFFARAFVLIASLEDHAAARELAEMCSRICKGEITQVFERHNLALSEAAYTDIVAWKTASLFETGCALGARFGGASPAASSSLGRFGRAIGIAFQIVDDCLDVEGDEAAVGKTLGTDADSGKVTLPVIHALRTGSARERQEIEAIFSESRPGNGTSSRERACDADASRERQGRLREILVSLGSLDYAHDAAFSLIDEARSAVETAIAPGPDRESLLALSDYVIRRQV
jgi:octaprenyl-diphosphate synthase